MDAAPGDKDDLLYCCHLNSAKPRRCVWYFPRNSCKPSPVKDSFPFPLIDPVLSATSAYSAILYFQVRVLFGSHGNELKYREVPCLVQGAAFSLTTRLIRLSYSTRSFLKRLYASACAGDSGLGSLRRSCTPNRICLMVIAGFHASSSLRIDKHTVPDG